MAENLVIRPVANVPWTDVERVFGTRGDPSRCWCQFYKLSNAEWQATDAASCSARLRSQVENDSPTPGLVACLDGEPVGWVAVEPRTRYPTALRGKVVSRGSVEKKSDASVWAITCFVVRVGFRRRGIAAALIRAAVEHSAANGARVIEGYPVDVAARPKVSSAELYHGTLTLFVAAGFAVVSTPSPGRALVALHLSASSPTNSQLSAGLIS